MQFTILKRRNSVGFTIIESLMVLAIMGLISVIIFIGVSQIQTNRRDSYRKDYARRVSEAMNEYYKNASNKYPGCIKDPQCITENARAQASTFITKYLPEGSDPTSGKSYSADTTAPWGVGEGTPDGTTIYYYKSDVMDEDIVPTADKPLFITIGHWCKISDPGSGRGKVIAEPRRPRDETIDRFAIAIYLERGDYFCLDNFTKRN